MAAVEFDFETLEGLAAGPALSPADAVMAALAEAQQEAEGLKTAARDEGFAAGRAEALAAVQPALEALAAAADGLRAAQVEAADALERRSVDLGLALAQKIVAGALDVQPERVVEAVRTALRGIVERERITVLVNPDDMDLVRASLDQLRASLGGIEHCEVQSERRVRPGGAIVRTAEGEVDATLETKLARAREVLEHELANG
jgi:flagellar biosynthesis/type III secretory pathway protein FliH